MPTAYGSDRVASSRDGWLIMTSRDKGWTARRPRTATSAEMPGTAVEWDDRMYEVVSREIAGGKLRYRLELWKPMHVVRQMSHYDEANELVRQQQWNDEQRRQQIGKRLEWCGLFVGHLPAEAQRHLNMLYGVSVARITMMSTIPFILFGIYCAKFIPIHQDLPNAVPLFPMWVLPFAFYFFLESIVRLRSWLGGRAMGSAIGWLVFVIWWIFGGRKTMTALEDDALRTAAGPRPANAKDLTPVSAVPRPARDETGLPSIDADAERKLNDKYIMREPYISFLPVADQRKMQQRFGFDPIAQGKLTAVVILGLAGLGAAITIEGLMHGAMRFSRVLSAMTAVALIAEQIHRLTQLAAARPAPSILGKLVRPFMSSILDAPPPQPIFEGEHRNAPLPDVWEE